tara:strand:- start:630 stop:1076 length:447 start_codon:yes stop_codon:yes gene_type:complete
MQLATRALSDYPDDLLGYLADPARGIVRKSKFIPTIAECCAFMDAQWDRQRAEADFRRRESQRKLPPPDDSLLSPEKRAENRAKISAMFRELSADLKRNGSDPSAPVVRTKAEIKDMSNAWLERYLATKPKTPMLSEHGLKAWGERFG